jgi:hypothetical protein
MDHESNLMPMSQVLRWVVVGALILVSVGLYFSHGRSLPLLDSAVPEAVVSPTR